MSRLKEENSQSKITFLGTGTSQGVPVIACHCSVCTSDDVRDKRLRVSVHLSHRGKSFVIDSGPDFRQQVLRAGIQDLDAVLMTHEHKDHIAGLDDIRAFNFKYKSAVPVYADMRVQEAIRREFYYAFEEKPYPGVPQIDLHAIDCSPFVHDGIEIQPIQVLHYKLPVLGFRMGGIAYITDAKTIEESEAKKLFGLDVLVLNALRKEDHISHLTLSEALEWIDRFQPKRAYLTHISHLMGKHEDVSKELPDNVYLAYDGLEIMF